MELCEQSVEAGRRWRHWGAMSSCPQLSLAEVEGGAESASSWQRAGDTCLNPEHEGWGLPSGIIASANRWKLREPLEVNFLSTDRQPGAPTTNRET